MVNHTASDDDSNTAATGIAALEARLTEIESGQADHLAFTSRIFTQTTFPHSAKSGDRLVLVNGKMTTTMVSTDQGLPYGILPRLLMCWLTREALRRKHLPIDEARVLSLGPNVSRFIADLGITGTGGGRNGAKTRLREQLTRLLTTVITVKYEDTDESSGPQRPYTGIRNTLIADDAMLWWDTHDPNGLDQDSTIVLSARFFQELSNGAIPLDARILSKLRRSPLAVDLYSWMTYKLSYHTHLSVVTWDQLRRQIGAGYPDTTQGRRDWKKKVRAAHQKVCEAWHEVLDVDVSIYAVDNGLFITPGPPSVPKMVASTTPPNGGKSEDPPF